MKRNHGQVGASAFNADDLSFMRALIAAPLLRGNIDAHHPPSGKDNFEPTRTLLDSAPPKKFNRTIWRSWARRIMERRIATKGGIVEDF